MTRRARAPGRLIAVEGIDGAGKTTFVRRLAVALRRRGWSVGLRREPNDPVLGELAQRASVGDPWTGGVYFTLDRQLARAGLEEALRSFDVVVSDRSFYSTLAYQGSALRPRLARRLARLQRSATVVPDRVVLLDLEPRRGLDRLARRSTRRAPLERRSTLRRVARAYRRLARPPQWIVVDARAPVGISLRTVLDPVERLLGRPRGRPHRRRPRRRT
jgi:dTMP kinase